MKNKFIYPSKTPLFVADEDAHLITDHPQKVGDYYNEGMTLREHYAGLAMQGIWSSCYQTVADNVSNGEEFEKQSRAIATLAIYTADALIKELEKE